MTADSMGMKRRILIVDDDTGLASVVRSHLPSSEFVVDTAADARQALDAVTRSEESYELALIDLWIPTGSDDTKSAQPYLGIQLAEQMAEQSPGTKLIAISLYGDKKTTLRNSGRFSDFIEKETLTRDPRAVLAKLIGSAIDPKNTSQAPPLRASEHYVTHNARALPLRIFLCHASDDKPGVRDLYKRLSADGFSPWLDEEDIFAGQDWELEIRKAVKESDIIIICLSEHSVNKRGFVQKEIKFALDVADEQPEGTIFLIPLRLEECVVPDRLRSKHWVDYFRPDGYGRLISSLRTRARELKIIPPADSNSKKKVRLSENGTNSPYVRRESQGRFVESDDVGRSLEQDVNNYNRPILLEHGSPKYKETISVLIWVTATNQRYQYEVALDATVEELKEYLLHELKIVRRFEEGGLIPYRINSKALGRLLNDNLTFRENGVPEMDTLTFHANIVAG